MYLLCSAWTKLFSYIDNYGSGERPHSEWEPLLPPLCHYTVGRMLPDVFHTNMGYRIHYFIYNSVAVLIFCMSNDISFSAITWTNFHKTGTPNISYKEQRPLVPLMKGWLPSGVSHRFSPLSLKTVVYDDDQLRGGSLHTNLDYRLLFPWLRYRAHGGCNCMDWSKEDVYSS